MKTHGNITLRLEIDLLEFLKARASKNDRSVNGEVHAILRKLQAEEDKSE